MAPGDERKRRRPAIPPSDDESDDGYTPVQAHSSNGSAISSSHSNSGGTGPQPKRPRKSTGSSSAALPPLPNALLHPPPPPPPLPLPTMSAAPAGPRGMLLDAADGAPVPFPARSQEELDDLVRIFQKDAVLRHLNEARRAVGAEQRERALLESKCAGLVDGLTAIGGWWTEIVEELMYLASRFDLTAALTDLMQDQATAQSSFFSALLHPENEDALEDHLNAAHATARQLVAALVRHFDLHPPPPATATAPPPAPPPSVPAELASTRDRLARARGQLTTRERELAAATLARDDALARAERAEAEAARWHREADRRSSRTHSATFAESSGGSGGGPLAAASRHASEADLLAAAVSVIKPEQLPAATSFAASMDITTLSTVADSPVITDGAAAAASARGLAGSPVGGQSQPLLGGISVGGNSDNSAAVATTGSPSVSVQTASGPVMLPASLAAGLDLLSGETVAKLVAESAMARELEVMADALAAARTEIDQVRHETEVAVRVLSVVVDRNGARPAAGSNGSGGSSMGDSPRDWMASSHGGAADTNSAAGDGKSPIPLPPLTSTELSTALGTDPLPSVAALAAAALSVARNRAAEAAATRDREVQAARARASAVAGELAAARAQLDALVAQTADAAAADRSAAEADVKRMADEVARVRKQRDELQRERDAIASRNHTASVADGTTTAANGDGTSNLVERDAIEALRQRVASLEVEVRRWRAVAATAGNDAGTGPAWTQAAREMVGGAEPAEVVGRLEAKLREMAGSLRVGGGESDGPVASSATPSAPRASMAVDAATIAAEVEDLRAQLETAQATVTALATELDATAEAHAVATAKLAQHASAVRSRDDLASRLAADKAKLDGKILFLRKHAEQLKADSDGARKTRAVALEALRAADERDRAAAAAHAAVLAEARAAMEAAARQDARAYDLEMHAANLARALKDAEDRIAAAAAAAEERAREATTARALEATARAQAEAMARAVLDHEAVIAQLRVAAATTSSSTATSGGGGNNEAAGSALLQQYRQLLQCSVCSGARLKDTCITRCMHVFCRKCVDARLETRQRKCPTCAEPFGAGDVRAIYM
ncbi:hypothetical protein BC828DRAFT_407156 [Blastocladiella britannica]|nr:hypothetical protein BC828DRAFT_407156 [Blastocladiella britannica]